MEVNWNLKLLYESDDKWQEDYNKINQNLKILESGINDIFENIENFKEFLELKIETERLIDKTFSYAKRKVHINITLSEYKEKMRNVLDLYGKLQVISNEFENLCIESSKIVSNYLKDNLLVDYTRYLNLILRKKDHTVSLENQTILSSFQSELQNIRNDYQEMMVNKIKEIEITYKDEIIKVNKNNFSDLLKSDDQEKRKIVYGSFMDLYASLNEKIVNLYINKIKIEVELSKARNFNSLLEEKMFLYEINSNFFNMVIEEINRNINLKHNYNKLKKETLNLKTFSNYDTLLSISDIPKINIDLEDGINHIKNALSILGNEYIELIDRMFEEGWVDVYPKENKISGSYTSIAFDGVPYIFLNYTNNINSLRLMAHEIGHAVNTYYSKNNNGYHNFSVTYFLTEVASKVNELLLNEYLLSITTNEEEKIYIINDIINALVNSIYGQTMFSEFENTIIKSIEEDENIENINEIFLELENKYNGDYFDVDELSKYEWEKISHFIMQDSYYVYQYSVGACLSVYIVNNLLNSGKNFKDKYIKFLSLGDSLSIEEILRVLEIDINSNEFITNGVEYLKKLFDELFMLLDNKKLKL